MRRTLGGAVAMAAVLVASSCSSGQPGDLTLAAQKVLVPKVQRIREVAATGNYTRLTQVVQQLKVLVAHEVADGQVSQSRANAILDAADTLLTDAQPTASPTPSSTPSSSSPTPSSTPSPTPSATPTPTPSASSSSASPGTTITIGGSPP